MKIEKVIISRGRRASAEQKGALLSYLEENINFAHEKFECDAGANTNFQKWKDLSVKLNAMGGALKNAEQWKQYWRDFNFRRNVKAKAAEEKRQIEASGINGIRKIKSLDDYERRAISIMTIDVIDGDGVSQERGFSNLRIVSYQEVVELNSTIPVESVIQPTQDIIVDDSPSPNIVYVNNTERPRRIRMNQRRRRTNNDDSEIRQYLELEKEKIALKRKVFEFQNENEKRKLKIKTKKADALASISESLIDLKNILRITHN